MKSENYSEMLRAGSQAPELLQAAIDAWNCLESFRRERRRCKRFTYGDQWCDLVTDRGHRLTEEELMLRQGNLPLKNNLIRRLVRNVLGVFRQRWNSVKCIARDPAELPYARTMQSLLDCNATLNRLEEIYARTMEDFLIGGLAVHKKWYGRKGNMSDCHTDVVNPDNFFIDAASRDIRGEDVSIIGEVHTLRPADLLSMFATDARTEALLHRLYSMDSSTGCPGAQTPCCRVVEVWHCCAQSYYLSHNRDNATISRLPANLIAATDGANARRVTIDRWYCTFLAPDSTVIYSAPSPYAHGSHPYVHKAYPFVDGEIHSFVSDIIDQQKLTNRLISMYDWILRSSAKGVLLFPEGALPDGVSIDDVAEEWSRFNGVIVYRPRPGVALPQQVSGKATDIGITELLEIQMKMMENISGVNGALQGKLDSNSMSGTLYNQQTRNSMSALADLLRSFDDFMLRAAEMDASNIRQFYTPARIEAITGLRPGLATNLYSSRNFFSTPYDFSLQNQDNT